MRCGTIGDKDLVVSIMTEMFVENPGVLSVLRKNGDKQKMLRYFSEYIFLRTLNRNGVYISANQKAAALCFEYSRRSYSIRELLLKLRFGFLCMPTKNIPRLIKREKYREKQRPKDGKYLYFWFLGALKKSQPAGLELANGIFELAAAEKLPIYLETTVQRNKDVYLRLGFKLYHTYYDEQDGTSFYFMKKESPSGDLSA